MYCIDIDIQIKTFLANLVHVGEEVLGKCIDRAYAGQTLKV